MKININTTATWILLSFTILIVGLVLFYFVYFLRFPDRDIPDNNSLFLSPANGRVIAILSGHDLTEKGLYKKHYKVLNDRTEGFGSGATLISIMMTPLNVHYQRAPLNATLIDKTYQSGRFFNAMKKSSTLNSTFQNEYNSLLFETSEGYQFRIIQIAGFVARRIVDFLDPGQEVLQGEKIGLIKLGSQVSIILDENFEPTIEVGMTVTEGETILAKKIGESSL